MENLQLTIELASPPALGFRWINGDGLVSYLCALDEYGRDFLDLRAREDHDGPFDLGLDVPLAETDGVRHASISFFDTDERRQEDVYGRYDEVTAHLVRGTRPRSKIPQHGGEFKPQVISLEYQPATRCVFFFRGNRERLETLFDRHFTGLGKKTSAGYGEVSGWEFTAIDDDRSLVANGQAMRPIPVEKLTFSAEQNHLSWRPPYHARENHTRCAPPGAQVKWDAVEA